MVGFPADHHQANEGEEAYTEMLIKIMETVDYENTIMVANYL